MTNVKSDDSRKKGSVVRLRSARKCPICGKKATQADHPFCSQRCADIDLNRWLSGAYAIPAVEAEEHVERDHDEA